MNSNLFTSKSNSSFKTLIFSTITLKSILFLQSSFKNETPYRVNTTFLSQLDIPSSHCKVSEYYQRKNSLNHKVLFSWDERIWGSNQKLFICNRKIYIHLSPIFLNVWLRNSNWLDRNNISWNKALFSIQSHIKPLNMHFHSPKENGTK